MNRLMCRAAVCALLALMASSPHAQDRFGSMVLMSGSASNTLGRLCSGIPAGVGKLFDIHCPTYAPSITTAGDVSITGNVSANKFIGDGSGLTNLSVSGDRITSDTHAMIVHEGSGYVSLTTGGSTWGYLSSGWSYLANLFATTVSSSLVSATNVSATYVDATRNGTVSGTYGYFRYISGTNIHGTFTGDGSGLTGVASGERIVSGTTNVIAWQDRSLTISTAGTQRMIVGENGNVGIGTSTPGAVMLDVAHSYPTIRLTDADAGSLGAVSGRVEFTDGSGNIAGVVGPQGNSTELVLRNLSGGRVALTPGSTPVLSALNNGRVGIGLNVITPTATLQVSGSLIISTSAQTTTPSLYVGTDGVIGIGTSNPTADLHVYRDTGDAVLRLQSGADTADVSMLSGNLYISNYMTGGNIAYGTSSGGSHLFYSSGVFSTAINPSGSVGIGTATPYSSLTVVGEAQVGSSGAACVTAANAGAIRYSGGTLYYCNASNTWAALGTSSGVTGTGSATAVAFWNGASGLTYDTDGFYWDATNNRLGIGTNAPAAALMVSSSAYETVRLVGGGTSGVGSSGYISFYDSNGSTRRGYVGDAHILNTDLYVVAETGLLHLGDFTGGHVMNLNNGNVGVQTLSPTATLQVSGTFTVSNTGQGTTSPSLFVASSGLVGVGTSAPNAMLEVANNGVPMAVNSTNGNANKIAWRDKGVTIGYLGASVSSSLDATLYAANAAAQAQFIVKNSSGNVGVSTSTPLAKLDVVGSISLTDALQLGQNTIACSTMVSGSIRYNTTSNTVQFCTGTGWVSLASGTTGGGTLTGTGSATAVAYWSGSSGLTYDTDGFYWDATNNRLGIGTNEPASSLHVALDGSPMLRISGAGSALTNAAFLSLERYRGTNAAPDYTTPGDWLGVINFLGYTTERRIGTAIRAYADDGWGTTGADSPGSLAFLTTPDGSGTLQERVRIDSAGRVGIGIGSPTATLQVSGSFIVSTSVQTTTPSLYVGTDGKVGIGTLTPSLFGVNAAGLEVKSDAGGIGAIRIGTPLNSWELSSPGNAGNGNFGIRDSGAGVWRVYITSSTGNVGISTTSPKAKLDVAGTISASSAVQIGQSSLTCSSAISGSIRYSTTSSTMEYCNSNAWVSMGPSDTVPNSFLVDKNSTDQTVTTNTWTKMTFSRELADSNGDFSSSRFTPTVPGMYLITGSVYCPDLTSVCHAAVYKNGAQFHRSYVRATSGVPAQITTIVPMNGTGDYVELYGHNAGGTTLSGNTTMTFFAGSLLGPQSAGSGGASALDDLTDVDTSGAAAGSVIRYDGTNWVVSTTSTALADRITSGTTSIVSYQNTSLTFITSGTDRLIVDEFGNVSFGISNTFATQRYYFYDDQTNKSAYRTVSISPWFKHSTNGTYYNIGMLMTPAVEVGSGISNQGYVYGQWTSLLRRDAPDAGSLDALTGNVLNVGHYTATGSTRHTSVTTGLMIGMYAQNGTMATMYGLRIVSRTGTNVTNSYGISQEGAYDRNYLAGNTGIGQGNSSPLANLDVAGTISASGAIQVGQSTLACSASISGSIRYNNTSDTLQVCSNGGWVSLASGTTAGTVSAASSTGAIQFKSAGGGLGGDTSNLFWDNANKRLGVATTLPSTTLHVDGAGDASANDMSSGLLILGPATGNHMAFDANEIMVRNGNTSATLYIQAEGGDTRFGGGGQTAMVGIGTTPATLLHILGGSPTLRIQDSNNGNSLVNEQRGGLELTSRHMNAGTARYSSMVKFGSNDNDFGGATKFLAGIAGYATETYGATTDSGMGIAFFTTPNDGGVSSTMFERMSIDQDGRVGISTTAPLARLDVVGTISASDAIQVGSSSMACSSGIPGALRYESGNIQYCNGSSWTGFGGSASAVSNTGAIQFNAGASSFGGDTNNLYWDNANKRLGLGTSAPSSSLHVNGSVEIPANGMLQALNSSRSNYGLIELYNGSTGNMTISTTFTGSDLLLLPRDKVGVGTSTPGAKLDVAGSISASTSIDVGTQVLGNSGDSIVAPTYTWSGNTNTGMFMPAANTIGFTAAGQERMRVWGANIGIGTTAPSTSLYVNGQIGGGFGAMGTSGTKDWNDISNARSGSGYTLLRGTDASNSPNPGNGAYFHPFSFEYASKDGSGQLTQFAIPYSTSSMDQGMYVRGRYSGTWSDWYQFPVINSSGKMGVNSNAPKASLDVVGTISASDAIQVGTSSLTCSSGITGAMRYTSATMQVCDGSSWTNIGVGVPAGTIAAFEATSCPSGWSEYTTARGRFLRGRDNGAGNDPDGTRAPGNTQADDFKSHQHATAMRAATVVSGSIYNELGYGSESAPTNQVPANSTSSYAAFRPKTSNVGGSETRPKNVTVTFCRYNGYVSSNMTGCPTGFTQIAAQGRSLGCMQTAEEASTVASWNVAADTCFTKYGGRLPRSQEWYIAMNNYVLTNETGNWEWLDDYATVGSPYDGHALAGNTAITDFSYANDIGGTYGYRCFIQN